MIDLALDSSIFINTNLDAALQELDMLFNTEQTELIGAPDYGTNFEQFLWTLNPSKDDIKKYIQDKISEDTYFLSQMDYEINVEILQGQYREIYYISIVVYDGDKSDVRTYEFK